MTLFYEGEGIRLGAGDDLFGKVDQGAHPQDGRRLRIIRSAPGRGSLIDGPGAMEFSLKTGPVSLLLFQ
jgi:hypothetical protein